MTPPLEWRALEMASTDPQTAAERSALRDALTDGHLQLGLLLEHAIRHRLPCRLAAFAKRDDWADVFPTPVRTHLLGALAGNRLRIALFRETAAAITRQLNDAGIPCAVTKGMALESSVYRGEGTRVMSDIDLMIRPSDRKAVNELLRDLGYVHGIFSAESRRIRPLDRAVEIRYALHPDHLPHFLLLQDNELAPFIAIDVANSLTWHSAPWQVPVEPLLDRARGAWDLDRPHTLPLLPASASFLFTVLHLFREAWFVDGIGSTLHVTLAQVADVYLSWKYLRDEILADGVRELIASCQLERPVAWVAEHVDRTLGSDIARSLGLDADEEWLASLSGAGGTPLQCRVSFRERLLSSDRHALPPTHRQ